MIEKLWVWIEKIITLCISGVFRLINKKLSEKTLESLLQFMKFGVVGVSNTLVHYVIYIAVLVSLQALKWIPAYDYIVANVVAFILSVLWSFYWNNKYVFKEKKEEGAKKRSLWKALLKAYASYAFTGLFLQSVLSILWVEVVMLPKTVAPLINLVITVPLNFVLNKFWAFRAGK